ncbi:MAG TPA: hypothetical protein VKU00_18830 [Chthonomonadaceae bacterium]|nr:hypothetical protein [Chthonomonadaceae bacterium]
MTFPAGGSSVRSVPLTCYRGRMGGGQRKAVCGLSQASRNRLRRQLEAMKREDIESGILITLTYGSEVPDAETAKRHLQAFCKRLLRVWPKAGLVWRLEHQQRGAIHFHLLLMGVRQVPATWIGQAWHEIVDTEEESHREAGTRVERVRGCAGQVMTYLCKPEVLAEEEERTGRCWGLRGNWRAYEAPVTTVTLTSEEMARLARALDAEKRAQVRRRKTASGKALRWARRRKPGALLRPSRWQTHPEIFLERLRGICGEDGERGQICGDG